MAEDAELQSTAVLVKELMNRSQVGVVILTDVKGKNTVWSKGGNVIAMRMMRIVETAILNGELDLQ